MATHRRIKKSTKRHVIKIQGLFCPLHNKAYTTIMDFDEAVNFILDFEGGYVFDANDPGGETKFGISKRAYPQWDIQNLTVEKAKAIYKLDYWDAMCCEQLPPALRLLVFDCGVNQGQAFAKKTLQRCLGVAQDGILGNVTFSALVGVNEMQLIDSYANARLDRYTSLPHWKHYGKGWAKRLLDVSLVCAFLANAVPPHSPSMD